MKQTFIAVLLVALSVPAMAQQCADLSEYQVQPTSFARVPLKTAIEKLVVDTQFKVDLIGASDYKVSANGISGPLSSVLQTLSQSVKFSYETSKCRLLIRPDSEGPQKTAQLWNVKPGDRISEVLKKWAKSANVDLFWETQEFIAEGALTAEGEMEDAITSVVSGLNAAGASLRVISYEQSKNHFIRIVEKK